MRVDKLAFPRVCLMDHCGITQAGFAVSANDFPFPGALVAAVEEEAIKAALCFLSCIAERHTI